MIYPGIHDSQNHEQGLGSFMEEGGKKKWHLSRLIKLLAEYQNFMGVKAFSIPKSELCPEVQRRLIWV